MQSTRVRIGPVVFSTDNDHHPLIISVGRFIEAWTIVGIQLNLFFAVAIPAAAGVNELCRRLLNWMDAVEAAVWATGQMFKAAVESWQALIVRIVSNFPYRLQYAPG